VVVNEDNIPIDYRYIEANSQFEKLTGLKVSDIIGRTVTEILPGIENDPADWIGRYGNVAFTGEPLTVEDYSESLDRWYKVSGYSPKKGFFAVTFNDITDRKRAEKKLKESEEKYRHLFENSPFSIVLLNIEGKIIEMNTATTKLFGYQEKDLIDKNYLTLTDIFPKETIPGLRLVQDLMSKGEPSEPIMKPQITKIYNKDQKPMWVASELSAVSISGELMILAIIQNITEKKIAEEKLKESERILRQQNIELKELDRLKTDFISIAAHDLKTPLISVGGYVDLILLREKGLKEEVKEDLNRVLNNVHRLDGYINRLLDVMKIEAKKVEIIKREENIHTIIIDCLSDLEFQVRQKDLTVNVDISENLKMRVDNFRISQVLLNLLSNAVKFTPKNGKIDISVVEKEENVLFKIKDNGKGLTPEEIQKLFGKFVTIEQGVDGYSTLDKGSGLGLYIARGFIEAHGGKIWVESKGRELGAEFSFTLPKQ
jgi:PAS domain S-box-containing protein